MNILGKRQPVPSTLNGVEEKEKQQVKSDHSIGMLIGLANKFQPGMDIDELVAFISSEFNVEITKSQIESYEKQEENFEDENRKHEFKLKGYGRF